MTTRTDRRPGPAPERSVRLATWGTAFLTGRASLDETTLRVVADDPGHAVAGLPDEPGPSGLTWALGRLRRDGVTGLRLVLAVPGDPTGLPGPATLTRAAVAAGECVLTEGGPALALVPETRGGPVTWQAHPAEARPVTTPALAEAERLLQQTLAEATEALLHLDCAGFGPEVGAAIGRLRADEQAAAGTLPPGYAPRAARVLTLAERVAGISALAAHGSGGATSATVADARAGVLRDLQRAARVARVAAYNSILEPAR